MPLVQPFARVSHCVQVPLPGPQYGNVFAHAAKLLQHPVGQVTKSQVQPSPVVHLVPEGHDAAPKQVQAPLEHASPRMPQSTHAAPPVPHCVVVMAVTHVFPEQHPFAQLAALQTH